MSSQFYTGGGWAIIAVYEMHGLRPNGETFGVEVYEGMIEAEAMHQAVECAARWSSPVKVYRIPFVNVWDLPIADRDQVFLWLIANRVKLTPGVEPLYAAGCPACGAPAESIGYGLDGDTIDISATIEAKGQGLFWAVPGHAVHTMLELDQCTACRQEFYRVFFDIIANAQVSQDWADAYFWRNQTIEETPTLYTVTPCMDGTGLPERWIVERIETPSGILDQHMFGPFQAEHSLGGPNGVSRCTGGPMWDEAAALCGRVFRLLTGGCHEPRQTIKEIYRVGESTQS